MIVYESKEYFKKRKNVKWKGVEFWILQLLRYIKLLSQLTIPMCERPGRLIIKNGEYLWIFAKKMWKFIYVLINFEKKRWKNWLKNLNVNVEGCQSQPQLRTCAQSHGNTVIFMEN